MAEELNQPITAPPGVVRPVAEWTRKEVELCKANHMDAQWLMCFPPFLGFVYTAIAGLLTDKMQSNEGSKHFTGRIKESQSFSHNTIKTSKKLVFCFCYPCFIYIYIDYFSMYDLICCWLFFFLFTVQVSKVMGVQALWKCCVYLAVLLSGPLCFSHEVHWHALCFQSTPPFYCHQSLCVHILHFHENKLFLALAWLHLTPRVTFMSHVKISYFSRRQLCISFTSGTHWACTVQRLCWHNSFIWQQSNATPRPSTPSTGCLSQFPSKEKLGLYELENVHTQGYC